MAIPSKQDEADDLEWDLTRLKWLADAMEDVWKNRAALDRDYPFLADETAKAIEKELPKLREKMIELRSRMETLRSSEA